MSLMSSLPSVVTFSCFYREARAANARHIRSIQLERLMIIIAMCVCMAVYAYGLYYTNKNAFDLLMFPLVFFSLFGYLVHRGSMVSQLQDRQERLAYMYATILHCCQTDTAEQLKQQFYTYCENMSLNVNYSERSPLKILEMSFKRQRSAK